VRDKTTLKEWFFYPVFNIPLGSIPRSSAAFFCHPSLERGDLVMPELRKRTPDLLILDLVLPQKTGFAILKELRADSKFKDIKVLVASNLSQEADKAKVKKFGVLDYFIKSDISIFELMDKVKKALVDKSLSSELPLSPK